MEGSFAFSFCSAFYQIIIVFSISTVVHILEEHKYLIVTTNHADVTISVMHEHIL